MKAFGSIPHVICIGSKSDQSYQYLLEQNPNIQQSQLPQIDSLILIDRSFDLTTPLLTEVHFEGFIKNAFRSDYNIIEDDNNNTYILSENNSVFRALRMLSWGKTREFVRNIQEEIDRTFTSLNNSVNSHEVTHHFKDLNELSNIREELQRLFGLANNAVKKLHDNNPLFDSIVQSQFQLLFNGRKTTDFAENIITLYDDWLNALRLIFLQSAYGYSSNPKDVMQFQQTICAEFGLKFQEVLIDLEKIGYVSHLEMKLPIKGCLSSLGLFADVGEDMESLEPIGSAFGGYIPPVVKVLQNVVNNEISELKRLIGDKIKVMEYGENVKREKDEMKRVLVFFVGGVTSVEVGMIRNLGRKVYGGNVEFIVGATEELTSNKFLKQLCPFL
ncbi:Sec1 family protein [Histomonas meleagridis]|uniref:Sec1 family protein n=1 Tax=Histomonas meleagridis TaxID=135588 RepID=UPI00355A4670|nr:Sec1 family protein [Histomonas meleagridis]KAH0805295.1 Sec1 family protein [Histomonas meleagridis]